MVLVGLSSLLKFPILSKFSIYRKLSILISIKIFWFALSLTPVFAQTTQFPYKAQIIKQNAYVRSGPGLEYYPTDTLQAGQMVEVYRHEPGGWCAIRPPEGSFSWVLAQQVEIAPDGLGRAKQEQVPVVVGSRLKNLQDVVHVYLRQGEMVELLEEETAGNQGEKKIWYKIAPPSGEFRWIFSQDIAPVGGPGSGSPPLTSAPPTQAISGIQSPGPGVGAASAPPGGSPQPVSTGSPGGVLGGRGSVALPPTSGGISSQDFQEQFRQIELDLANRVIQEPSRWELQDLYARAETLLGQAPDASSRSEARQLLARISRFMEVQRQYVQILLAGRTEGPKSPSSPGSVGPANVPVVGSSHQTGTVAGPPVLGGPANTGGTSSSSQLSPMGGPPQAADRFDAMGRLTRVVSAKPGAPTYALLDERGEVVCYLTPAPGINLHPLEGKWIAVTGVTGLMLEPRAKHVAVKQVALVDPPGRVLR